MFRRIAIATFVVFAMVAAGMFLKWRMGLLAREVGEFGGERVVVELRQEDDGIFLRSTGHGLTYGHFADISPDGDVQSAIEMDLEAWKVRVTYGEVVRTFDVSHTGKLVAAE